MATMQERAIGDLSVGEFYNVGGRYFQVTGWWQRGKCPADMLARVVDLLTGEESTAWGHGIVTTATPSEVEAWERRVIASSVEYPNLRRVMVQAIEASLP